MRDSPSIPQATIRAPRHFYFSTSTSSHPPIIYPLAVTAASTNPAAKSYIAFLQSPEVKAAFSLPGFVLLR